MPIGARSYASSNGTYLDAVVVPGTARDPTAQSSGLSPVLRAPIHYAGGVDWGTHVKADTTSTDSSIVLPLTSREVRARAWSAIGFAVLYVAGFVPLGELLGSFGDPDAAFADYFAKDSNRIGAVLGGVGVTLAGLAFLWFLSNLHSSVERVGPLPGLVTAAGTTFVVLLFAGIAALVTVPYARTFGGAYGDDSVLLSGEALLPQLGYVLVAVLAMWTAAVFILATTLAARANGSFPRWLVRLGFVAAVFVFLLGSSVMGLLGVPVWAFAVGIHWFRRGSDVRDISLQPER